MPLTEPAGQGNFSQLGEWTMTERAMRTEGWLGRRLVWGAAVALFVVPVGAKLLLLPGMLWDAADFVFAAVMLGGGAALYDRLSRRSGGIAYRLGACAALAAIFLLIWLNLAVGIIGDEDNPANLMFAVPIALAVGGAIAAGLRPNGMACAMVAAAVAEAMIVPVALIWRLGADSAIWPREVIALGAFFTGLWLAAAWLFRRAAGNAMPAA